MADDIEADIILTNTGTGTISSNDFAKLINKVRNLEAENAKLREESKEWREKFLAVTDQVEVLIMNIQKSKDREYEMTDVINSLSNLTIDVKKRNPGGLNSQTSVDSCSSYFSPDPVSASPTAKNIPAFPSASLPVHQPDAYPFSPSLSEQPRQVRAHDENAEMALPRSLEKPGMLMSNPPKITTAPVSKPPVKVPRKSISTKTRIVNDDMCFFIKNNIVAEKMDLGRILGLESVDLQVIAENYKSDAKEICYQIMTKWVKKKGAEATTDVLIKALEKIERRDVRDNFCEEFNIERTTNEVEKPLSAIPNQPAAILNQPAAIPNEPVYINYQQQQHSNPYRDFQPPDPDSEVKPQPNRRSGSFNPGQPIQQQPSYHQSALNAHDSAQQRQGAFNPGNYQQPSNQGPGYSQHLPFQQEPNQHGGAAFPGHGHGAIRHSAVAPQTTDRRPIQDNEPHDRTPPYNVPSQLKPRTTTNKQQNLENFFYCFFKNQTPRAFKDFKKGVDKVKNFKRDETKRISDEMGWDEDLALKFDSDIKSNLKVTNILEKWTAIVLSEDSDMTVETKIEKLQDFCRALRSIKDGWEGREDVVKELRNHVRVGIVGTQAPSTTLYIDLPYGTRFGVARELNMLNDNTGNGCSLIAENLGIEKNLIRYLSTRPEPGHQVLRSWETQADATVERLHSVLMELGHTVAASVLE